MPAGTGQVLAGQRGWQGADVTPADAGVLERPGWDRARCAAGLHSSGRPPLTATHHRSQQRVASLEPTRCWSCHHPCLTKEETEAQPHCKWAPELGSRHSETSQGHGNTASGRTPETGKDGPSAPSWTDRVTGRAIGTESVRAQVEVGPGVGPGSAWASGTQGAPAGPQFIVLPFT